jgi:hypothetical protein
LLELLEVVVDDPKELQAARVRAATAVNAAADAGRAKLFTLCLWFLLWVRSMGENAGCRHRGHRARAAHLNVTDRPALRGICL